MKEGKFTGKIESQESIHEFSPSLTSLLFLPFHVYGFPFSFNLSVQSSSSFFKKKMKEVVGGGEERQEKREKERTRIRGGRDGKRKEKLIPSFLSSTLFSSFLALPSSKEK